MIWFAENLMATGFVIASMFAVMMGGLIIFCTDILDGIVEKIINIGIGAGTILMCIGFFFWSMIKIWIC